MVFKSRAGMEAGPYGLYEWQIGIAFRRGGFQTRPRDDVPMVFKSRAGMEAGPYGLYEWQIGIAFRRGGFRTRPIIVR